MSEGISQSPKHDKEDDSFVRLAEGGFDTLAAEPEMVAEEEASTLATEAPFEIPAAHQAAISEVKENLAKHAEATVPTVDTEEYHQALDAYGAEQQENIRRSRAAEALYTTLERRERPRSSSKTEAREDAFKRYGGVKGALERDLGREYVLDREQRQTTAFVSAAAGMTGMLGMMGSEIMGANEAISALGGITLPEIGLDIGIAGAAGAVLAHSAFALWQRLRRARHRAQYKKIYGQEPKIPPYAR